MGPGFEPPRDHKDLGESRGLCRLNPLGEKWSEATSRATKESPAGLPAKGTDPKDLGGDEGDIHHFGVQASVYLCSTTMRLHRSIAILLLGVFLSNTMEAHQLLKLPALFEHLSEHQTDSPTSWAEFISEHYIHGGQHADQEHHHGDLPFQSDNHCANQTIQARLPDAASASVFILNALDLGVSPMDECMLGRNEVNDVWQPPRS